MEDRLKELMQVLGKAINESLSDSDRIADVIAEIERAGYNVFLVLEAASKSGTMAKQEKIFVHQMKRTFLANLQPDPDSNRREKSG